MPESRTFRAIRAIAAPESSQERAGPQLAINQVDLPTIAQHMYSLMLRNIASNGFLFSDPCSPSDFSKPGCVVAAPSYPSITPGIDQDYVFHWTRDAAITAFELIAAQIPTKPGGGVQALIDYVTFSQACQTSAERPGSGVTIGHACYRITGDVRPWSEQSDGPALQIVAILQAFNQLDAPTQAIAKDVINKNLNYLLNAYQTPSTNLWEEHIGLSFFTRSAQLRCFKAITSNTIGIPVPPGVAGAITWLESALQAHWNGTCYVTMLAPPAPGVATSPTVPSNQGYDPNIDIVCASIYGDIPCTDTKLLATAALLRRQWADSNSSTVYPINVVDQALGLGPMFGRYPGDVYDGNVSDPVQGGHPWALCTCNFAELYYTLANEITRTQAVPFDNLSEPFFAQIGVTSGTAPATVVSALQSAGDAMLRAVIYHSDNLELSEQFNATSGFEMSVRNLTWSYASFLSAVRAKTGQHVRG